MKRQVLNMRNSLSNGNVHVYSDKQIPVDMDTIVILLYKAGKC